LLPPPPPEKLAFRFFPFFLFCGGERSTLKLPFFSIARGCRAEGRGKFSAIKEVPPASFLSFGDDGDREFGDFLLLSVVMSFATRPFPLSEKSSPCEAAMRVGPRCLRKGRVLGPNVTPSFVAAERWLRAATSLSNRDPKMIETGGLFPLPCLVVFHIPSHPFPR